MHHMVDATKTKQQARSQFEEWAWRYDHSLLHFVLFRPTYLMFLEEAARWSVEHGRSLDWFDIGCGTGILQSMILQSNLEVKHVVGLDYAWKMCRQTREKLEKLSTSRRCGIVHGDSEHLPFREQSFDLVSCGNSFHHYPHPQAVIREMRRLLRPGGRLMIIDGFRDNVVGWVIFDVIIKCVEKTAQHLSWLQMRELFEEAGFQDIRQKKFNLFFPAFITVGTVGPAA